MTILSHRNADGRLWFAAAVVGLILPFTTLFRGRAPTHDIAVNETTLMIFSVGMLVFLGLWITVEDFWLGMLAAYVAVRAYWTPTPFAFETAQAFVFGCLIIVAVRKVPVRFRAWVVYVLVGIGCAEVLYAALQQFGLFTIACVQRVINPWALCDEYRALWGFAHRLTLGWVQGSLGNPNHLGSFLAITVAFAPAWLLPVWFGGHLMSHSVIAAVASGVAVSIRYWRRWKVVIPIAALCVCAVFIVRASDFGNLWSRLAAGRLALQGAAFAPLFGHGQGSWRTFGPLLQRNVPLLDPAGGSLQEVHNDVAQFIFDGGGTALFLLAMCAWKNRGALRDIKCAAALCAIVLVSLGSFPFHIPSVMGPMLVVIGLSTAKRPQQEGA